MQTGGIDTEGKWDISFSGEFTEVYDCFVMLQCFAPSGNNIFKPGGQWIDANSILQVVYVQITSFNKDKAWGVGYCSESKKEYEADNFLMFTLVVMGV